MIEPDDEDRIALFGWILLFVVYGLFQWARWLYRDWMWQATLGLFDSVLKDSTVWGIIRYLLTFTE